ncbi:MAG: PilN domain-containing protein [Pyrinomonadaceae bacterium]|nr:PilN domain-containing protein [Pyrinomonadaceae bacterium]
MIKINLLESVTDRPSGAAMVEDRVSSPRVQTLLLALTVFGLLVLGVGYDYVSANSAHQAAQHELENQRRINQQMLAVNQEQAELEQKSKDIQGRIDAIKKLRESQQGPGAVLRDIKTRFDSIPGLYLQSIEQQNGELTIKGESPNEYSVTRFGQSLEFSAGLFTNLNIETQRQAGKTSAPSVSGDVPVATPEVVAFTVKCNYAAPKTSEQGASAQAPAKGATSQVALKK